MSSIYQLRFDICGNILNNTTTSSYSILDLEQNVFNDVNDLYSNYSNYTRCINNTQLAQCYNNPTPDDLQNKFFIADDSINSLQNAITYIESNYNGIQNNDEYNRLIQNYNSILESRQETETKINDLLQIDKVYDTKTKIISTKYNDSIYTTVLLSTVATSLVFYLFVNM